MEGDGTEGYSAADVVHEDYKNGAQVSADEVQAKPTKEYTGEPVRVTATGGQGENGGGGNGGAGAAMKTPEQAFRVFGGKGTITRQWTAENKMTAFQREDAAQKMAKALVLNPDATEKDLRYGTAIVPMTDAEYSAVRNKAQFYYDDAVSRVWERIDSLRMRAKQAQNSTVRDALAAEAGSLFRAVFLPHTLGDDAVLADAVGIRDDKELGDVVMKRSYSWTETRKALADRYEGMDFDEVVEDALQRQEEAGIERRVARIPRDRTEALRIVNGINRRKAAQMNAAASIADSEEELRLAFALSVMPQERAEEYLLSAGRESAAKARRVYEAASALREKDWSGAFVSFIKSAGTGAWDAATGIPEGLERFFSGEGSDAEAAVYLNKAMLALGLPISKEEDAIANLEKARVLAARLASPKRGKRVRVGRRYKRRTFSEGVGDVYGNAVAAKIRDASSEELAEIYRRGRESLEMRTAKARAKALDAAVYAESPTAAQAGEVVGYMLPTVLVGMGATLLSKSPNVGAGTASAVLRNVALPIVGWTSGYNEVMEWYDEQGDATTLPSERRLAATAFGLVEAFVWRYGLGEVLTGTVAKGAQTAGKLAGRLGLSSAARFAGGRSIDFANRGILAFIADSATLETKVFAAKYGDTLLLKCAVLTARFIEREGVGAFMEGVEEATEEYLKWECVKAVSEEAKNYEGEGTVDAEAVGEAIWESLKEGMLYAPVLRGVYGGVGMGMGAYRLGKKREELGGKSWLTANMQALRMSVGLDEAAKTALLRMRNHKVAGFSQDIINFVRGTQDEREAYRKTDAYLNLEDDQKDALENLIRIRDGLDAKLQAEYDSFISTGKAADGSLWDYERTEAVLRMRQNKMRYLRAAGEVAAAAQALVAAQAEAQDALEKDALLTKKLNEAQAKLTEAENVLAAAEEEVRAAQEAEEDARKRFADAEAAANENKTTKKDVAKAQSELNRVRAANAKAKAEAEAAQNAVGYAEIQADADDAAAREAKGGC